MDPVVAAAWISGAVSLISLGGTVAVAVVGFRSAAKSALRAIDAEHDRRLWEKQADVYVKILADAGHRGITRDHKLKPYRFPKEIESRIEATLASYTAPPWFEYEAEVRAYASPKVIAKFQEAHDANEAAYVAEQKHVVASAEAKAGRTTGAASADAAEKVKKARQAAIDADGALIDAVRDELHIRPSARDVSFISRAFRRLQQGRHAELPP